MIPTPPSCYLRVFFLFATCILAISACTNTQDKDSDKKEVKTTVEISGGIYRVPLRSNPATLDPAQVRDWYGETIAHQLFDGLVRFDQYLSIMPALAQTWQVENNGKVYRFHLHPNALFHDGTAVTVDDVIFSLTRLLRVENAAVILPHLLKIKGAEAFKENRAETVAGLVAVDDQTLMVHLTEPHVPFLTALGMCYAKIIPRAPAQRPGEDFGRAPVGSGPFRFVSWDNDRMIRLERFPAYYDHPAFMNEIEYKIYPGGQDTQILTDFKAKALDEMPVFGNARQELSQTATLQWFHRSSLSLFFYGMNTRHPHLKNKDLRKALALAVDRQTIVSRVYNDQYDMATTILPPGMPGYHPENQVEASNMDMALKLLQQAMKASAEKMPPLEIVSATRSPSSTAELALVKAAWKQLGIQVLIKYITDWAEFEAYLKSDAVQIYRYAWFADMPEPDNFLYALFGSDSPVNFMRFDDKTVDHMFTTARKTVDPVERSGIYRNIESKILASFPLIPMFYMSVDQVYQPHVKGIMISALGAHTMRLNHIWLDPAH